MEDGAVLGSLFSRLQSKSPDEIMRLLCAYQEIRQDRCAQTQQSDAELVTFSTLPPGPARDERDAGFALSSANATLDWEDAGEEMLRGAWDEFRGSFGYEAYDAADDWWVDWGVLAQRTTAVRGNIVADTAVEGLEYAGDAADSLNGHEQTSCPPLEVHSPLIGLRRETIVTR